LFEGYFDGPLLICLNQSEIAIALVEAHSGACGGHFAGRSIVQSLIHMGYYWRHMEKYFLKYVKKCHKCQEHKNLIHALVFKLHAQVPIWPFPLLVFDIIGNISRPSSTRHTSID
jgi:hypothetical protein